MRNTNLGAAEKVALDQRKKFLMEFGCFFIPNAN
jgi:hypothetical protein